MIAIDSSVLIDLLGDDAAMADAAEACVRDALARGPVVLCDVVVSEITAGLGHGADIMDVVEEMGMSYLPVERRSAIRAGEMQRRYNERRRRGGLAGASPRTVACHWSHTSVRTSSSNSSAIRLVPSATTWAMVSRRRRDRFNKA